MSKILHIGDRQITRRIVTVCLIVLYYSIFSQLANFNNGANLSSDTWSYQSIGVNLAKGHGFHRVGSLEEYEEYKFNNNPSPKHFNYFNLYAGMVDLHRLPGYPLFVGTVYSIFGVNPLIVKHIQLILIIIVASLLPWLGHRIWKRTGYLSGLLASVLFISINYSYAELIMAESLVIFTLFIVLLSYLYFDSKRNLTSSLLLGVVFGISILIKGSLVFIPVLFLVYYIRQYIISREFAVLKSSILVVLLSVMVILPWSIFASRHAQALKVSFQEIKMVLMDGDLTYIEKVDQVQRISPQVGKGVVFKSSLSQSDRVLLEDSIFPAVRQSGVFLFSQDKKEITPMEKLALVEQIITIPSVVVLRVLLPKSGLLGAHNEFVKKGKWNPVWRINRNSFYNKDNLAGSSDLIRVVNFYLHNPVTFFTLASDKIVAGFSHFRILWMLLILFIIETVSSIVRTYSKGRFSSAPYSLLMLPFLVLPLFIPVPNQSFIIVVIAVLIALFIVAKTKIGNSLFSAPPVFHIILINFILITIVGFGRERYTAPMDFIIILASVNYIVTYIFLHSQNGHFEEDGTS